ncbi:MAG: hypothetical protein CVU00_14100 [Bacteroidetes bacterium HGW-Bacteroidetes-17]|jgi:protein-S-isoprenylcysteine O-methyltransferase Ste14|nr:MAG: hypothetical protein CVU00_14100 [Bacteroidetes bacterium HGW-Bacteroidetes-17]
MRKYYPELLVFLQLSFISLILISAPIFNHLNLWLLLELSGMVVVIWAVYEMRLRNIDIRPIVKQNGVLVTSGPYYLVRHPMYSATLMVMIALVGEYYSNLRLAYLLALLIVLLFKIKYEEKGLVKHFPAYIDYIKKSKRLIPFIY